MVGKRGWIRILESTIAVLLVSSVLVIVYSGQIGDIPTGMSVRNLEEKVLRDITYREDLRLAVLNEDVRVLDVFLEASIPNNYVFRLKVCDLDDSPSCKLDAVDVVATLKKNVIVDEIVVSSNLDLYSPKKVRLYI